MVFCHGAVASLFFSGCATPTSGKGPGKKLSLDPGYNYEITAVRSSLVQEEKVGVEEILLSALEKHLAEKKLLWSGEDKESHYALSAEILEYEMGSAFKRWLLPGYGSTVLSVQTDIIDVKSGEVITSMNHKQSVIAGGAYSIGAWKSVFDTVARDIATDLERKYSGKGEGFFIELEPWLEKGSEVPKSETSYQVYPLPLGDKRLDKGRIGERHAAFNVSMGDIYANREVATYLSEALQNELLASGNRLSENSRAITLSGDVVRFWVWTDTTALYWDVKSEIEVTLIAQSPETGGRAKNTYTANTTSRTYLWPSKELVGKVVSDAVKSLMYQIREDRIWAKTP